MAVPVVTFAISVIHWIADFLYKQKKIRSIQHAPISPELISSHWISVFEKFQMTFNQTNLVLNAIAAVVQTILCVTFGIALTVVEFSVALRHCIATAVRQNRWTVTTTVTSVEIAEFWIALLLPWNSNWIILISNTTRSYCFTNRNWKRICFSSSERFCGSISNEGPYKFSILLLLLLHLTSSQNRVRRNMNTWASWCWANLEENNWYVESNTWKLPSKGRYL